MLGLVDFPVRPPAINAAGITEFELRTPQDRETANERRPFVWRYLDWPRPWADKNGLQLTSFPLAVASLNEPFQGVRHFLNAHSIFALLPQKMTAAALLSNHDEFNLFLGDLGVPLTEIIWANKSVTWAKKKDPNYQDHASGLKFSRFMISAKVLVAAFAYLAKNKSMAEDMQKATLALLDFLAQLCDTFELLQGSSDSDSFSLCVADGVIRADCLKVLLDEMGFYDKWENQRVYHSAPSLGDFRGSVRFADIAFFVFRNSTDSALCFKLCKVLVRCYQLPDFYFIDMRELLKAA